MVKVKSADASVAQIRADVRKSAKAFNSTWGIADKSGLFLKKQKMVGTGKDRRPATITTSDGKTKLAPRRTNRCLRRHALKVLMSAAVHDAAQSCELENFSMSHEIMGENPRAPALFTISKGATLLVEHALAAYCQSIFKTAISIVDNAGVHQKVTAGAMRAAAEITNTSIQRATAVVPFVYNANAYKRPLKKKAPAGKKQPEEAAGDA